MSEKKETPEIPVRQLVIDQLAQRLGRLERNFESVVTIIDEEAHRDSSGVSTANCFLLVYLAFLAGICVAREIYGREEKRKR